MFKTTHTLKKHKFFEVLENVFVGEKIEGEGGYVNLLKVKSEYFRKKVRPDLENLIEEKTKDFPEFREELMDKLYDFFHRYLNETGTPFMFLTPYYASIYDRIYGEEDVKLYWKTSRHYYIKSDRIFRSMKVEVDGFSVFFDVSNLEYKKANEKRELIYEFENYDKDERLLTLKVYYREGNRKTDISEIRKKIKDSLSLKKYTNEIPSEEAIKKAISIFERQSKVDYFICKDARSFLKEQFDLWLFQYLFGKPGEVDTTLWTEKRIKQIQVLKEIAYRVIDFIARFEDELLKIWLKPRFVFNSNYVITLDRLENKREKGGIEVIKKILNHPKFEEQVEEWKSLGIVDENFDKNKVLIKDLHGERLNPDYRFLPVDTKYFKDLELEILSLFDNLDEELDGWLIKSENFQALNTILPRFRGKVQTIYIDPPFNKGQDADYDYLVDYKDATWITMLENRLRLAKELLSERGSIFVRCDYNGNWLVRSLMNEIFGEENFKNEIIVGRKRQAIGTPNKFEVESEYLILYGKSLNSIKNDIYRERSLIDIKWTSFLKQEERKPPERVFFGKTLFPPKGQHFPLSQDKVDKLIKEHYLRLKCAECSAVYYWDEENSLDNFIQKIMKAGKEKFKYLDITLEDPVFGVTKVENCINCGGNRWKVEYLTSEKVKIGDDWKDIPSYSDTWKFKTENSEVLLKRVIDSTSSENDLILDFFLGSGTTAAVAHKLKRKWIGIEMGEQFYNVILPRMKKVLAYDKSGISKEKEVRDRYNEKKAGGFFKYFELEQYEEILRTVKYKDVLNNQESFLESCLFVPDEKLLYSIETVFGELYLNTQKAYSDRIVDIPQVLSFLKGKAIKKIHYAFVEFSDGEKIEFENRKIKICHILPALWWR